MPLGLGINGVSEEVSDSRLVDSKCIKCPELAVAVINKKDTYCRQCFLLLISHKFRGTLGRKRIFTQQSTRVVIGYDGGASATTLISLVQTGLSAHVQRKLFVEPTLVTILTETDPEKLAEFLPNRRYSVFEFLKETGLDWIVIHIGAVFVKELQYSHKSTPNTVEEIPGYSKELPDVLANPEIIRRLKIRLLYRVAESLSVDKIMMADTAPTLAKRILNHVAMGRGAQISHDSSLVDRRHPSITIIRPLKEFSDKEIGLFNYYSNLNPPVTLARERDEEVSIQGVTENFISGLLSAAFPSTINTVMSTASKVQGVTDANQYGSVDINCALCFSPVEPNRLEEKFCYACHSLISESLPDSFLLPNWLL